MYTRRLDPVTLIADRCPSRNDRLSDEPQRQRTCSRNNGTKRTEDWWTAHARKTDGKKWTWITHLWARFERVARVRGYESFDDFTVILRRAFEKLLADILAGEHFFEL
jgi:hypothetical protein